MKSKVYKFIKENNILTNGESVILGVSGGADSICMLYILNELKNVLNISLSVVHVNHMIRGAQADADERFVKSTCRKLEVPFFVERVNVPQLVKETGMSEEEAGRQARYDIFGKYLKKMNADKISIAHHLNDHSETILLNLFRGTGIKGLMGIPVKRNQVILRIKRLRKKDTKIY